jgi:hypothetical protein
MALLNSAVGEAIASKPRATPTAVLRVGNTNRGQNLLLHPWVLKGIVLFLLSRPFN